MAQVTVISAVDVRDFSTMSKSAALCDLTMIRQNEEYLLNCFAGLYEDLKNDLVDYTQANQYSNTATYAIGEMVKQDGSFFICIAPSVGIPPTNATIWTKGKRFKSDCFNTFYCEYLANYLADSIQKVLDAIRIGKGDDTRIPKAFEISIKAIEGNIAVTLSNMINYMKKTPCLQKYLPNTGSECGCDGEEKAYEQPNCLTKTRRKWA